MRISRPLFRCAALALAAAMAGGCAQQRLTSAELVATPLGAAAGGAIGYSLGGGVGQSLFIAVGSMLGGTAGYLAARRFSMSDRAMYTQTLAEALDTSTDGEMRYWLNPDTGLNGTIRPIRTYHRGEDAQVCRDYRAAVNFRSSVTTGAGTACRGDDGQWTPIAAAFG